MATFYWVGSGLGWIAEGMTARMCEYVAGCEGEDCIL